MRQKNSNPEASQGALTTGSLYAKEAKVYPREVEGRFAHLRNIAMYVLLGLFYGVVWLSWNEQQMVLFDLPARKFHVFGLTFWPQDFIYLALLLLLLALLLFFVTALAGRLWCGYACPQTVWTEAFLLLERWTEGKRGQRMKLDAAPWSINKVMRKTAKQILWVSFALWTGYTFVGYFVPIRQLAADILTFSVNPWALFWLLFYALATYGNAGYLREQVCKYMCPYARFQSAMFDKNTLVISYDKDRGEPRGSRKRSQDLATSGLGSCIDCTLCVQVCPTGIDIREGLQIECIACAACIDVCDQVMDKMEYPRGLIRYTTENTLDDKPVRIMRPRIWIYTALLSAIAIGLVWSISMRTPLRMEVIRDRNALYREVGNNEIENVYTLRVVNMAEIPKTYRLTVTRVDSKNISYDVPELTVQAGSTGAFPIRARIQRGDGSVQVPITLKIVDPDNERSQVSRDSVFFMP